LGSVEAHNDPTSGPGIDLALIAPANEVNIAGPVTPIMAANPRTVTELAYATLHGGKSGQKLGYVAAPLNASRSLDGRTWINCWAVVERQRGFAAQGDSGAAVILDNGEALGHLVAAYGCQRPGAIFQTGLVQDAESLLASNLSHGGSLFLPEIIF
jgi:hypothetical protein